jgi:hypothetical protein
MHEEMVNFAGPLPQGQVRAELLATWQTPPRPLVAGGAGEGAEI